jgi:ADP-ribose pyrophosphatase
MAQFKVISTETVFKSVKVQVDRETIQLPDGSHAEWDLMVYPDFYEAVTIKDNKVLMTKEWRQGPHDYLTQFTKARAPHKSEKDNLQGLARELSEELGVIGGKYQKLTRFSQGERLSGFCTVYLVTGFTLGNTNRDLGEIQEIVELPIKGLYQELINNHIVMAETLLVAKILESELLP